MFFLFSLCKKTPISAEIRKFKLEKTNNMTETTKTDTNANQALLEERLKKLDQKNFDWAAWKKGTLLVLEKIFGQGSLYLKELAGTDYHYNSWSLRDTAGSEDPVKASVRELLHICITDVTNRSEPETPANTGGKEEIMAIVKQFLDDNTLSELKKIANSDKPDMIREEQIMDLIKEKLPKHQEAMLGKLLLWVVR